MACNILHWLVIFDVIVLLCGGWWAPGTPSPAYWNPFRWGLAIATGVLALMCFVGGH